MSLSFNERRSAEGESGDRRRAGQVVTLPIVDAEFAQGLEFGLGLDALGDDLGADLTGERDQPGGQGAACGVGVDVA